MSRPAWLAACALWAACAGAPPPGEPAVVEPTRPATAAPVPLVGTVTDVGGTPVAGAEVFVYDSADTRRPADALSARTGPDGRYRVLAPPGRAWVVARVRTGSTYGPLQPGDRHSGAPTVLDLAPPGPREVGFVVAELREAALRDRKIDRDHLAVGGRILDPDGKPLAGLAVAAWRAPGEPRGLPDYVSAWTWPDGRYRLDLPRGAYVVAVLDRVPPDGIVPAAARVNLEGERDDLDLTAPRAPQR